MIKILNGERERERERERNRDQTRKCIPQFTLYLLLMSSSMAEYENVL